MPDLPTITVTSAQATRITTAFGDVATYRAWLREQIKDYVVTKEAEAIYEQATAQMEASAAQVRADLDGI